MHGVRRFAARTAGVFAVALTLSLACSSAYAQTTNIGGSLSGPQTFNATSGTALITGNATLSADVTINLGFQIDYLVVGGGGGGSVTLGPSHVIAEESGGGGGGGGGGVMIGNAFFTGSAGVTVGSGGAGVSSPGAGSSGQNSALTLGSLTITGTGGGAGTMTGGGGASGNGVSGGSGPGGGGGGAGQAGGDGPAGYGGYGVLWQFDESAATYFGAGGGGADGGVTPLGGGPGVLASGLGGDTGGGSGGDPFGDPSGGSGQNGVGAGGGGGVGGGSSGSGGSGTVQFVYMGDQIGTATNGSQRSTVFDSSVYTAVSFSTGMGSFTVTQADLTNRLVATLDGDLTGSGGLAFVGPGSLTLTGSSNFTGASSVQAAKLYVNGQVTSSTMSADAGGLLGGTGSILAVNVLAGGTLSPGAAGNHGHMMGDITIGTLTLGSGGTTMMQIDEFGDHDKITGTSLTNGGTLDIQLSGDSHGVDTQFDIYDFTSVTGTFAGISMAGSSDGWQSLSWYAPGQSGVGLYDYGQEVWQSDWTTVGGESRKLIFNQVSGTLTVVPEPSTIAMAGAGLAAAAIMRWRRRLRGGKAPEEAVAPSAA